MGAEANSLWYGDVLGATGVTTIAKHGVKVYVNVLGTKPNTCSVKLSKHCSELLLGLAMKPGINRIRELVKLGKMTRKSRYSVCGFNPGC
jgi:hypothetical protein